MSDIFNLNDAGPQKSFDVIPAETICTLQLKVRAGGVGEDQWLRRSNDGNSEGLDCEFTVVGGEHDKRKLWQLYTLRGTEPRHAEAGEISLRTLRAMVESAYGIKPDNNSEAAQAARHLKSWAALDGLRFMAKLGVRPAQGTYPAKNTILEIITPDRVGWQKPEQISIKPASDGKAANVPAPANAIGRPKWATGG
jgi:hypothetical protein